MRILILKVFGIGNVVQATPMMQAIRQLYPEAEIDVLCDASGAEVLTGWDLFHRVIPFRNSREVPRMPGYDLYVLSRPANGWLKHVVPEGSRMAGHWSDMTCWTMHEVEWNMRLAWDLGYEEDTPDTYFHLTEFYPIPIASGVEAVGIHIGSLPVWKWKKWPVGHWVDLTKQICASGREVVVVGGRAELGDARALGERLDGQPVVNLVGTLNLKQTASVISQCSAFISSDSGPMHIASALGVPTIGLFGPTSVTKNRPWSGRVLQSREGLMCRPCQELPGGMDLMRQCGHVRCMTAITPDLAFQTFLETLRELQEDVPG